MPPSRKWIAAAVALAAAFSAAIRWIHLDQPLERDEGEYALMGGLLLEGVPPYREAYNMKLPGVYVSYALIMALFGKSPIGIHLGLLLVNAASVVLTYFLARRLLDAHAGIAAAWVYSALSTSFGVLGPMGHATHFVVLPALGGLILLLRESETLRPGRMLAAGTLLGTALLMKQPGIFFLIAGLGFLLTRRRGKEAAWVAAGALLPLAAVGLWLAAAGVFSTFWFWTFRYALEYGSIVDPATALRLLGIRLPQVTGAFAPLWILAAAGAAVVWFRRRNRLLVLGFAAAGALSVLPGLYFRPHYFIPLLPAISVLAGAAISEAALRFRPAAAFAGLGALMALCTLLHFPYWFSMTPAERFAVLYETNVFAGARAVGEELSRIVPPQERIAVLGSEPEICFYARRKPATGFIYMSPLMERQPYAVSMHEQMIRELESNRPAYLVYVNVSTSWGLQNGSCTRILEWYSRTVPERYARIGVADMIAPGRTDLYWGPQASLIHPQSKEFILVFRRLP